MRGFANVPCSTHSTQLRWSNRASSAQQDEGFCSSASSAAPSAPRKGPSVHGRSANTSGPSKKSPVMGVCSESRHRTLEPHVYDGRVLSTSVRRANTALPLSLSTTVARAHATTIRCPLVNTSGAGRAGRCCCNASRTRLASVNRTSVSGPRTNRGERLIPTLCLDATGAQIMPALSLVCTFHPPQL
jgi:hypothetical protein